MRETKLISVFLTHLKFVEKPKSPFAFRLRSLWNEREQTKWSNEKRECERFRFAIIDFLLMRLFWVFADDDGDGGDDDDDNDSYSASLHLLLVYFVTLSAVLSHLIWIFHSIISEFAKMSRSAELQRVHCWRTTAALGFAVENINFFRLYESHWHIKKFHIVHIPNDLKI